MFLRCGCDHHTIKLLSARQGRARPYRFEVKDWPELARASDYLVRRKHILDWARPRHHIGHNMACYHRNPDICGSSSIPNGSDEG